MIEIEKQNIEIKSEDIQTWCPMFGLPCYDRQLTEPFFMSFVQTVIYCKDIGLKFAVSSISDSLINRARNNLVAKFLANPQFTHLIFLDVDLEFKPEDILKLIWHDKEIMTGSYPIKDINWEKVVKMSKDGVPAKDLLKKATRFVVNPRPNSEGKIEVNEGAMAIHDAGTGFMCIKREVFEKMIDAYPELKFRDDTGSLSEEECKWTYAFFNSYIDDDNRFLSEDYGFCRYWQKIGGKVWVDPGINIKHLGRLNYEGSMIDQLVDMSKGMSPKQLP